MLKKLIGREDGFTLIEMMIVLLVISVLILIAIPNVMKRAESIDDTGCDALVKMVEGQVQAYRLELRKNPASAAELVSADFLDDNPDALTCSDGRTVAVNNGDVIINPAP
ncbi:competence type IV pilus major pilin ComGC [Bhargavaea ullalensis]|uniref:Competence protein ComGC n=1 Tax=Bhargavaea ullalensis TaxID=1265685 RepID=A0ABV2G918_9BACL